ncbi:hypothetical protein BJ508DRAFT_310530 [Ascobolus immersus RN42]|uniref:Uncharacterized protein n=1 Tax=Ascobolus immersus RN42 TaxID=1160509 RepID=A0A3N4HWX0_ASCIM|nr:hypothetical protein BJ508DRAFT_310530 [Ascobolus immersus RN42]
MDVNQLESNQDVEVKIEIPSASHTEECPVENQPPQSSPECCETVPGPVVESETVLPATDLPEAATEPAIEDPQNESAAVESIAEVQDEPAAVESIEEVQAEPAIDSVQSESSTQCCETTPEPVTEISSAEPPSESCETIPEAVVESQTVEPASVQTEVLPESAVEAPTPEPVEAVKVEEDPVIVEARTIGAVVEFYPPLPEGFVLDYKPNLGRFNYSHSNAINKAKESLQSIYGQDVEVVVGAVPVKDHPVSAAWPNTPLVRVSVVAKKRLPSIISDSVVRFDESYKTYLKIVYTGPMTSADTFHKRGLQALYQWSRFLVGERLESTEELINQAREDVTAFLSVAQQQTSNLENLLQMEFVLDSLVRSRLSDYEYGSRVRSPPMWIDPNVRKSGFIEAPVDILQKASTRFHSTLTSMNSMLSRPLPDSHHNRQVELYNQLIAAREKCHEAFDSFVAARRAGEDPTKVDWFHIAIGSPPVSIFEQEEYPKPAPLPHPAMMAHCMPARPPVRTGETAKPKPEEAKAGSSIPKTSSNPIELAIQKSIDHRKQLLETISSKPSTEIDVAPVLAELTGLNQQEKLVFTLRHNPELQKASPEKIEAVLSYGKEDATPKAVAPPTTSAPVPPSTTDSPANALASFQRQLEIMAEQNRRRALQCPGVPFPVIPQDNPAPPAAQQPPPSTPGDQKTVGTDKDSMPLTESEEASQRQETQPRTPEGQKTTIKTPPNPLAAYEEQLRTLEAQNKARLLRARAEQQTVANPPVTANGGDQKKVLDESEQALANVFQVDGPSRVPQFHRFRMNPGPNQSNHALADYQMQLMVLEQQNKRRLLRARAEQDAKASCDGESPEVPQKDTDGPLSPGFPPPLPFPCGKQYDGNSKAAETEGSPPCTTMAGMQSRMHRMARQAALQTAQQYDGNSKVAETEDPPPCTTMAGMQSRLARQVALQTAQQYDGNSKEAETEGPPPCTTMAGMQSRLLRQAALQTAQQMHTQAIRQQQQLRAAQMMQESERQSRMASIPPVSGPVGLAPILGNPILGCSPPNPQPFSPEEYQQQLAILEEQGRRRILRARAEQDNSSCPTLVCGAPPPPITDNGVLLARTFPKYNAQELNNLQQFLHALDRNGPMTTLTSDGVLLARTFPRYNVQQLNELQNFLRKLDCNSQFRGEPPITSWGGSSRPSNEPVKPVSPVQARPPMPPCGYPGPPRPPMGPPMAPPMAPPAASFPWPPPHLNQEAAEQFRKLQAEKMSLMTDHSIKQHRLDRAIEELKNSSPNPYYIPPPPPPPPSVTLPPRFAAPPPLGPEAAQQFRTLQEAKYRLLRGPPTHPAEVKALAEIEMEIQALLQRHQPQPPQQCIPSNPPPPPHFTPEAAQSFRNLQEERTRMRQGMPLDHQAWKRIESNVSALYAAQSQASPPTVNPAELTRPSQGTPVSGPCGMMMPPPPPPPMIPPPPPPPAPPAFHPVPPMGVRTNANSTPNLTVEAIMLKEQMRKIEMRLEVVKNTLKDREVEQKVWGAVKKAAEKKEDAGEKKSEEEPVEELVPEKKEEPVVEEEEKVEVVEEKEEVIVEEELEVVEEKEAVVEESKTEELVDEEEEPVVVEKKEEVVPGKKAKVEEEFDSDDEFDMVEMC